MIGLVFVVSNLLQINCLFGQIYYSSSRTTKLNSHGGYIPVFDALEWGSSIYLTRINRIDPITGPNEPIQRGLAVLDVVKKLYGQERVQLTAPFAYVKYSL